MLPIADVGMPEVPLTLIARRWPCAFLLSDSKGMLDVKDTVLRREVASIALATRKTKNYFRGMLSAFRAGVSVVVGIHKPCCLVICSLQSTWLGVIFFIQHTPITLTDWSCREWRHVQQSQDDSTFGKAAGDGSEEPWTERSPF